jgi:hypothetical protein
MRALGVVSLPKIRARALLSSPLFDTNSAPRL